MFHNSAKPAARFAAILQSWPFCFECLEYDLLESIPGFLIVGDYAIASCSWINALFSQLGVLLA